MRFPEEIELAQKRQDLAVLLEKQGLLERELSVLKSEIRSFERTYEETLGSRITELEQLEWQISGLLGSDEEEEHQKYYHSAETVSSPRSGTTTSLLDDDPDTTTMAEEKSLKSLYREVAKLIHPDLAADDNERYRRQELMSIANLAYEEGDRATLQRILREWQIGPDRPYQAKHRRSGRQNCGASRIRYTHLHEAGRKGNGRGDRPAGGDGGNR